MNLLDNEKGKQVDEAAAAAAVDPGSYNTSHYPQNNDDSDRPELEHEPYNVTDSATQCQRNSDEGDNDGESHRDVGLYETDKVFMSRDVLLEWVVTKGRKNGWVINIRRTKKNKFGEPREIWLKCDRGGEKKSIATVRKCGSKRINCPFSLCGRYTLKFGGWLLKVHNDTHNHERYERMECHAYAMRLSKKELSLVKELTEQNMEPRNILLTLRDQNADNVSSLRTVYNARHKINKAQRVGETPMQNPFSEIQGEESVQQAHGEPQGQSPSPPPPVVQNSRIITRPVPLSADYMLEMLHLQREQHAHTVWQSDFLHRWGDSQGFQHVPPPPVIPYVPPPYEDPPAHEQDLD